MSSIILYNPERWLISPVLKTNSSDIILRKSKLKNAGGSLEVTRYTQFKYCHTNFIPTRNAVPAYNNSRKFNNVHREPRFMKILNIFYIEKNPQNLEHISISHLTDKINSGPQRLWQKGHWPTVCAPNRKTKKMFLPFLFYFSSWA